MRRRWQRTNELWNKHKSPNNPLDLIGRLDYMRNLSSQRPSAVKESIRVVYSSSGRPTAAIVNVAETQIDYTLFWLDCRCLEEAQFLTAVVNSGRLEQLLEPLMPKGQFGSRHVQKHLWRLPIPEYVDSDPLHVELAEAGEAAAIGAKALWDGVRVEREDKGQSTSVTVARREIRKWLSESAEGQRVEELVSRLLGG